MAYRISRGLLEKVRNFHGGDQEKLLQNFQRGLFFFLSEFPRGVTHFSRISGQDVTTSFLGIPCSMGKIHKPGNSRGGI